jgi:hypothetical protein
MMGVYFQTKDGKQGMLDVSIMLREQGLTPYKVQNGNVLFTSADGSGQEGLFSVADWAQKNGYSVTKIDGFNTPPTALDVPPTDMTALDQSVWYMDGARMDALRELFPQVAKLDDGRVVVLDRDGLWKTMWSDTWQPPQEYPSYSDRVESGDAVDTRTAMRSAGIAFLFGLAGVDPKIKKNGDLAPKSIEAMLHELCNNAPMETKMALGKFVEQTTGVDQWKFSNALYHPDDLAYWLQNLMSKTTFDFRMVQSDHAEVLVAALHKVSMKEFRDSMNALVKADDTKSLTLNMKEAAVEFITMLHNMDVIRDIGKVTGLDDWKKGGENDDIDLRKLPPMPSFIPRLVRLLQFVMPMAKDKALMIARGPRGLKAIIGLMGLIDVTLFSLCDVPDSTAKSKMFMVLKTLQNRLESKLAMSYHPINNTDGSKVNLFMQAKQEYAEKRETVYKLIQTPKEMWSKTVIDTLRQEPNIEAFYDQLPDIFAKLLQSFVALDTAYDMQPWVDTNYQDRIMDAFATMTDTYGPPPPDSGYLATNSPRAALNIIDTLATASGMILNMPTGQRKHILRSPVMFANLMKMVQTASVAREIGAVEVLSKMGIEDPYSTNDPTKIWSDNQNVSSDQIDQQVLDMYQQMMNNGGNMGGGGGGNSVAPVGGGGQDMTTPDQMAGAGAGASKASAPAAAAPNGAPPMAQGA